MPQPSDFNSIRDSKVIHFKELVDSTMSTPPIKQDSSSVISAKQRTLELARRHGLHTLIEEPHPQTSFSQRAAARLRLEQARAQKNLEQILARAEQICGDEAGSRVDPDWFSAYLELAKNSQTVTMQQLWSQILAMEVVTPGRFSVRALQTLTIMTQREAQWFQRAVQIASRMGGEQSHKLLLGAIRMPARLGLQRRRVRRLSLGRYRLAFNQIMQLSELGLLYERELESSFAAQFDLSFEQSGKMWLLRPRYRQCKLIYYRLTPIGDELAQLIEPSPIVNYQTDLAELLEEFFELQY
ncbi:TIGR03899 family protein [Celerinatantimonas yamalensis]|uniref:TIGR03899 family protein n=1 Tax=Celerinatantimonas yamalensis TaxID=559956 RepID=A0ABW9GA72_9GAMM